MGQLFLSPVHSFRAIAILFVVAGHTIWAFQWQQHPALRDVLADFFENGTVLFIFVSGFLFQHLSARFRYREYLRRKFENVVVPYLLLAIPAIAYSILRSNPEHDFPQLAGTSLAYKIFWFYLFGGATVNYALWFIPMITVYFVLSPLFIFIIRHPKLYWSLALLLPVSLLAHRAKFPNLDLVHLGIYYLPAYVMGMCCSQFRSRIEPVVIRFAIPLFCGFLLSVVLMAKFAQFHGNYDVSYMFSREKGLIDWLYLQKIYFCFALWGLVAKYDALIASKLSYVADVSFTIFFLHLYFIAAIEILQHWRASEGSLSLWAEELALVVALCVLTAVLGRFLLGRRSRYVLGS